MIYSQPNAAYNATLENGPTGLVGTIGVQLLNASTGAVVVARATAGIVEAPTGSGTYLFSGTAPASAGEYVVFWDTGTVGPTTTASEELTVTSTAPAAAIPNGSDLCALSDVRGLMQKKPSDTSQDTLIQLLITRASFAVMRWADRQFAPVSAAVTHTFEWEWTAELCTFAPWDLQPSPLPTIYADTDQSTPYLLSVDEYRLWPQPARDGVHFGVRLKPFGASVGRQVWRNRQVQVTGTWGFPSVPVDVTMAACSTVIHWLTVNTATFRHADQDPNVMAPPVRGIPLEAMQLLNPYRRAGVG